MLSSGGVDQTVDRIVFVVGAWLDSPIAKIDDVLRVCVVLNMCDIANGVIEIAEILQFAGISRRKWYVTVRSEVDETEGVRVVGVISASVVAVFNDRPLPL